MLVPKRQILSISFRCKQFPYLSSATAASQRCKERVRRGTYQSRYDLIARWHEYNVGRMASKQRRVNRIRNGRANAGRGKQSLGSCRSKVSGKELLIAVFPPQMDGSVSPFGPSSRKQPWKRTKHWRLRHDQAQTWARQLSVTAD